MESSQFINTKYFFMALVTNGYSYEHFFPDTFFFYKQDNKISKFIYIVRNEHYNIQYYEGIKIKYKDMNIPYEKIDIRLFRLLDHLKIIKK